MCVGGNAVNGLWGDTTLQVSETPTQVGTNTDWNAFAAGNDFFIGLKNDGGLWSWGGNRFGQLGNGTRIKENAPIRVGSDTNPKTSAFGSHHGWRRIFSEFGRRNLVALHRNLSYSPQIHRCVAISSRHDGFGPFFRCTKRHYSRG